MQKVTWWALVFTSLVIFSCAGSPTPYQKEAGAGGYGYSDIHLRENIYEVKFRGNLDTDRETQKKYVYRRAVELCKEKGFSDFELITTPPDVETATVKAVIECIP